VGTCWLFPRGLPWREILDLLQQETPLKPPFPELPNWSENFCLSTYDPKSGIGLWLHLGRWRRDLNVWRETVVVTWPDGTVSGYRAFGNARAAETGPGGPNFAIRVERPNHRLNYSFLGGVQRVPSEVLKAGLQTDGARHLLGFELTFDSEADIWDLHKVGTSQKFLGTGHIEQVGRVRGQISFDGQVFDYDSMGNRDHSMGPRDTPTLGTHQWLQGYFENDVRFLVYDAVIRGNAAPVFCEAVIYEGDTLYEGRLEYPWRLADAADAQKDFGFKIHYENGTADIRTAGIQNTAYLSFTAPNDHYIGVFQGGTPPLTLLEQPTAYTLNGDIKGFGWLERTAPGIIGFD
jgi:hypothetical protein